METIREAKDFIEKNKLDGVICPCCNKHVQKYKRKLNSGMCLFLIGLYRCHRKNLFTDGFTNKEVMAEMKINTSSLDYSVMKHFGLMEEIKKEDKEFNNNTKKSGYWKITDKGKSFVKGLGVSFSHVMLYNNNPEGFSGSTNIKKALGSKFNYQELMNA